MSFLRALGTKIGNGVSAVTAAVGSGIQYGLSKFRRTPPPPPCLELIKWDSRAAHLRVLEEIMRDSWDLPEVDRRGFVDKYVIDPLIDRISPEDTFEDLWIEDAELLTNVIAISVFLVGFSLLAYRRWRNVR
ncbi:hypothetical protein MMC31_000939 [Peltigera leucophlebia]|nr:hypothetical protein [Peltigera leucophlebia]